MQKICIICIRGKKKNVLFVRMLFHATVSLGTHRMSSSCEVCCHHCYVSRLPSTHIIDLTPVTALMCVVKCRKDQRRGTAFFFFFVPSMQPNVNTGLLRVQQDSSMFHENKPGGTHIMCYLQIQNSKVNNCLSSWLMPLKSCALLSSVCISFTVNICYSYDKIFSVTQISLAQMSVLFSNVWFFSKDAKDACL